MVRSTVESSGRETTLLSLPFLSLRHFRLLMQFSQSQDDDLKAPILLHSKACLPSD